jgi:hypothetical protein
VVAGSSSKKSKWMSSSRGSIQARNLPGWPVGEGFAAFRQ